MYSRANISRTNWFSKTAGGLQLWTDLCFRNGYRIQRHALRLSHRLLDPANHRISQGTYETCLAVLDLQVPKDQWLQRTDPFVILIHGLTRTGHCMSSLRDRINSQGFATATHFSYASTRATLVEHATALKAFVESFPPNSTLSFVCHSMGNIVLRTAVGLWQAEQRESNQVLGRMRSVVMLAPPNQGASIARLLGKTGLFGLIAGPGASQLGLRWQEVIDHLATPPCPFAIIAGDLSQTWFNNPLIEQPNDLLVTVNETKLEGAKQFHCVPIAHTTLMTDARSQDLTIQFLKDHLLSESSH